MTILSSIGKKPWFSHWTKKGSASGAFLSLTRNGLPWITYSMRAQLRPYYGGSEYPSSFGLNIPHPMGRSRISLRRGAPLRNGITDGWGKQLLTVNMKKASSKGGGWGWWVHTPYTLYPFNSNYIPFIFLQISCIPLIFCLPKNP